jgi:PKD repeat protein
VIPDGTYQVQVRGTDNHGQIGTPRVANGIVVTHPANNPPVAKGTVSCNQNVCTFDGTGSTDENTPALSYAWTYGTSTNGISQGTGTGPKPIKTFTAAGTYNVLLTVKDEWGSTATTTVPVTVAEPSGNAAPTPTLAVSCNGLICTASASGTVDPNTGDTVLNSFDWGDGSAVAAASTATSATHTYAAGGTFTVKLTSADGWGKSASATKAVQLAVPAGNQAPNGTFTVSCTGQACTVNSSGTADPDGDGVTYSWNWGDNTAASTGAAPAAHTYGASGTRTITLTVTDWWGLSSTVTRSVTT